MIDHLIQAAGFIPTQQVFVLYHAWRGGKEVQGIFFSMEEAKIMEEAAWNWLVQMREKQPDSDPLGPLPKPELEQMYVVAMPIWRSKKVLNDLSFGAFGEAP